MMYQIDKVRLQVKENPDAFPVKNKPGHVTVGRNGRYKDNPLTYYAATKKEAEEKLRELIEYRIGRLKELLGHYDSLIDVLRKGIAALEGLSSSRHQEADSPNRVK
jgi:hypothetical protein